MNDKSVPQTKYRRLESTYPTSDQDLMDALVDLDFVNNVIRMEKENKRTRLEKLDASHGKNVEDQHDRKKNAILRKMMTKQCVGSLKQNTNNNSQ